MTKRELERLAGGEGVSIALLVAIFVSKLSEAIGSAIVCALASISEYAISRLVGARFMGAVDGFAAGALLAMLSAR